MENIIVSKISHKELVKKVNESGFYKFYDKFTGRFIVPIREIGYKESMMLLQCIGNGYLMTLQEGAYILYSEEEAEFCQEVSNLCDWLYDLLKIEGVHFFKRMSISEYIENERYQKGIDNVLSKTSGKELNMYSLAIGCEGGYLVFKEAYKLDW